jgi:predicted amidohydrolase YtcJ
LADRVEPNVEANVINCFSIGGLQRHGKSRVVWLVVSALSDEGLSKRFHGGTHDEVVEHGHYWHKYDDWQVLLTAPRLGEERTNRQFQPKTLAARGAKLSFGSDWPVTTHSPLEGIQVAVTRQMEPDGPPWMPEERMSVEESLAAYTSGVAFQAGRDDAGTLRPGAVADVAWMAQDPRRVDPMDIGSIEILGTIHAGEMIYRSESLG